MKNSTASIPAIRYADADRAIAFLKDALGFTEKAVYRDHAGLVTHAELVLTSGTMEGMVMIGTFGLIRESAAWFVEPHAAGGVTSSIYWIVEDCEPVYRRAQAAGAEFLQPLETKEYGGKAFIVRDPEGHIWSFGEYDPWAVQS